MPDWLLAIKVVADCIVAGSLLWLAFRLTLWLNDNPIVGPPR